MSNLSDVVSPFYKFRCNFDPFSNLRRDSLSSVLSFPHAKPGRILPLFYLPLSFAHFFLMIDTGGLGGGLALD